MKKQKKALKNTKIRFVQNFFKKQDVPKKLWKFSCTQFVTLIWML